MVFTIYVLYSEVHDKIYIGYTSNLLERFKSHNKLGTKGYTKKYRPWVVAYTEYFDSKKEAMGREKWLKSGVGRRYIHETVIPDYLGSSGSYPP